LGVLDGPKRSTARGAIEQMSFDPSERDGFQLAVGVRLKIAADIKT
jgi:hypothetical protein